MGCMHMYLKKKKKDNQISIIDFRKYRPEEDRNSCCLRNKRLDVKVTDFSTTQAAQRFLDRSDELLARERWDGEKLGRRRRSRSPEEDANGDQESSLAAHSY